MNEIPIDTPIRLGAIQIGGAQPRNPETRFLPWFDTFAGDVFRRFDFLGVDQRGEDTVLVTRALSDPDVMFREQRDSSGDLCFRNASWDAAPLSASLKIGFRPARETIDGMPFTGLKYWFEYESDQVAIHRLVDRPMPVGKIRGGHTLSHNDLAWRGIICRGLARLLQTMRC